MQLTELFLAELDREAPRSRRALEQVPDGKYDWKPHEKSMTFGYLAELVATMPSWITMGIKQDALDLNPPGEKRERPSYRTRAALVDALDKAVADARAALSDTTDDHLMRPWRLLVGGRVVWEAAQRHVMLRDTMNHLAHHRGQLTVYLRLLGAKVPALYGPSADEQTF
jgi:uncharacterized damage-inducible protein DinB